MKKPPHRKPDHHRADSYRYAEKKGICPPRPVPYTDSQGRDMRCARSLEEIMSEFPEKLPRLRRSEYVILATSIQNEESEMAANWNISQRSDLENKLLERRNWRLHDRQTQSIMSALIEQLDQTGEDI